MGFYRWQGGPTWVRAPIVTTHLELDPSVYSGEPLRLATPHGYCHENTKIVGAHRGATCDSGQREVLVGIPIDSR
jgi:hypothetical protein